MSTTEANFISTFQKKLFAEGELSFNELCIELFHFQYEYNKVYRTYCDLIKTKPKEVASFRDIPFIPISTFKTHKLQSGQFKPDAVFTSSGTTGLQTSRHFVKNLELYEQSFRRGFSHFYGANTDYCILGLLPSYLEREGSSLIYMVNDFIQHSSHAQSGFFLNNHKELYQVLAELSSTKTKVLLIGVSFALLDFAEKYELPLNKNLIVMETGGMKGRRKELIREELHSILCKSFSVETIHSEYGMTELISQAYSKGDGIFESPPWMKIIIREQDDPFQFLTKAQVGAVNIIDLANVSSCAFIQTDDLGKQVSDNQFEVLGRLDVSDIRGCNLLLN